MSLAVGLGGLLVSVLASWLLLSLGRGRTRAVEIAEEMTVELRQAQSRFRTAFADAPIGMALIATDGRWLQANRALCSMLDYTEPQLQQRTFLDVAASTEHETSAEVLLGLATGVSHQKACLRRDGRAIVTNVSLSLVRDDDDAPQHFIAQIEDTTERRRADQRFRDLLEAAPDAMVIVDEDGAIVLVNGQTLHLFGYEREELIGQPVDLLIPERLRPGHDGHRTAYDRDPAHPPDGRRTGPVRPPEGRA